MVLPKSIQRHACGFETVEILGLDCLSDPRKLGREAIRNLVAGGAWVCFWENSDQDAFDWRDQHMDLAIQYPVHQTQGVFQHAESSVWIAKTLVDLDGRGFNNFDYAIDCATWIGVFGNNKLPRIDLAHLPLIPWPDQPKTVTDVRQRVLPKDVTCEVLNQLLKQNRAVLCPSHETESIEVFELHGTSVADSLHLFLCKVIELDAGSAG